VQVLQRQQHLRAVEHRLVLRQPPPFQQDVEQLAARTVLQREKQLPLVLETVKQPHDELVPQLYQDFPLVLYVLHVLRVFYSIFVPIFESFIDFKTIILRVGKCCT